MAKKMNAFKLSAATLGLTEVEKRRPTPPATALYLAQVRPPVSKAAPSRSRQQIAIQIKEESLAPRVVKIIHTDSN